AAGRFGISRRPVPPEFFFDRVRRRAPSPRLGHGAWLGCLFTSDNLACRKTGAAHPPFRSRQPDAPGRTQSNPEETVSGNRVVKAFGMEEFEIRKFRAAAQRLLRETMRWVRAYVASSPLMDLLQPVVISLLLLYARDKILAKQMTLGMFFAFVVALFKSYEPVKRMGSVYQQFQQAEGATIQV